MKKTGFYIIKDNFFNIFNDPFLKGNKQGNRPHYYCFEDSKTGIYWIIPMSSKLEKYKRIIKNKEKVTREHVAREIERKARKVLSLLKRDVRLTPLQPNVMKIYRQLNNKDYI